MSSNGLKIMPNELEKHLKLNLRLLEGDWVKKKSNYEDDICQKLSMITNTGRYWDAKWNQYLLEFKKGTSMWLDLVRYSETLKQCNEDACKEVLSLFFIPNKSKEKILEIICVRTELIIEKLKLSEAH